MSDHCNWHEIDTFMDYAIERCARRIASAIVAIDNPADDTWQQPDWWYYGPHVVEDAKRIVVLAAARRAGAVVTAALEAHP